MAVHLLDLPDLCLEKIFSYCLRNLNELKQCNQFLKDFIESHARLKKPAPNRMFFFVSASLEGLEDSLQKYEESNEIYDSVSICVHNEREPYFDSPEITLGKHAEFIETFDVCVERFSVPWVLKSLKLLKDLKNIEKISLDFNGQYIVLDDFTIHRNCITEFGVNNFPKLKELHIGINLELVFDYFGNCKTIESLTFNTNCITNSTNKFFNILKNNKISLKKLSVCIGHYNIDVDMVNMELLAAFFGSCKECDLDLETFELSLDYTFNELNVVGLPLCEFLISQKDLTKFVLKTSRVNLSFFKIFDKALPQLRNLKNLTLNLNGPKMKDITVEASEGWNLSEVEKIEILIGPSAEMSNDLTSYIFRHPSSKLKKILLSSGSGAMDFNGGVIEKITTNYRSLTKLDMKANYSCNDIFSILKFLKKLQVLIFRFPRESVSDPAKFNDSADLILPEIVDVDLEFNDSVQNDHLFKFMQLLKNMSTFTIAKLNIDDESFDIITKELPKLTNLRVRKCSGGLTLTRVNIMKANIENFNMNASKFKYDGYTIDEVIYIASKFPGEKYIVV